SVTGACGAGYVFPAGSPFETQTMMFAILLPAPSTSASLCTAVVCFLAHAGSASIAIVGSLGAVPVKVTVPVIADAANATPGHAAVSITPAARDNRVAVLRIVRLLREEKSSLSKLYTGPAFARQRTSSVLESQGFRKPRVAQRNERLPPHQPARHGNETPADSDERGDVQKRRTDPLGVKRRHHLPLEIHEVHGEQPDAPQGQGERLPLDRAPHQEKERHPEVPRHEEQRDD